MNAAYWSKKRFQFESFWLHLEGFDDAVREGWQCAGNIVDPSLCLDSCFRNLARHLQSWEDKRVGNLKMQIALTNLIIHRFDAAQEIRDLSPKEWWLRRTLKQAVLGMSSLERTMARQRSRMRRLKDGDANTKLFHTVANGRRVKIFIPAIRHAGELIMDQQRKEAVFFDSYNELLGRIQNRERTINLDMLDIQDHDLQDLGGAIY
jgi:hypothetical protein